MTFSFNHKKRDIIRIFLCFAASVFCSVISGSLLPAVIIWFIVLFGLNCFSFNVDNKIGLETDLIIFPVTALFTVYFTQFINIAGHEISEGEWSLLSILNNQAESDSIFNGILFEILLILTVYLLMRLFRLSPQFAGSIAPFPFLLLGLTDFFVYQSRGTEFVYADIAGAKTAMNVIGGYSFDIITPLGALIIPYALFIAALFRIKSSKTSYPWIAGTSFCAVLLAVSGVFSYITFDMYCETSGYSAWGDEASYYSGFIPNFFKSIEEVKGTVPDGYSLEAVNSLSDKYGVDISASDKKEGSNIIVIMNESFSDLSVFDELGDYDDPMPFFHSLQKDYYSGFAYSSVYGGKTPNSEYEFLTGISTALLPTGTIPYTTYINSDTYSLVQMLDSIGYKTIAMHPYESSGWNRTSVYPLIGFQDYMFIDDFDYSEDDIIRTFISDECAYDNLIAYLEEQDSSAKTFTFMVTIQNHGGYSDGYDNFEVTDYIDNDFPSAYELNTYLSLVRKSDEALEGLLDYLEEQDEEYTVLIYGDHQPNIEIEYDNTEGYNNFEYKVPFVVWTNFDVPEDSYIATERGVETSINYLALDVIEASGVSSSPYFELISKFRDTLPIIYESKFYSESLENFYSVSSVTNEEESAVLNDYRCFAYNTVFDSSWNNILLASYDNKNF